MMRTSNPTLNDQVFATAQPVSGEGLMTVQGTVNKTLILTGLLLLSAGYTWNSMAAVTAPDWIFTVMKFAWLVPFVVALVISFKPTTAPLLAPIYALTKGVILGAVSFMLNKAFDGIVLTAVLLTVGVLVALLAGYSSGLIRPSQGFRRGLFMVTGGIFFYYLAHWILGFFGIHLPGMSGNSWFSIGFSVVVVITAALNLVLDFEFIEKGAASGAPKHMEWYGAFGLLVTLVWLYLEILRLLAKLRSRD